MIDIPIVRMHRLSISQTINGKQTCHRCNLKPFSVFFCSLVSLHFDPTGAQFDTQTADWKVFNFQQTIKIYALLFGLTYSVPLRQDVQHSTINWHIHLHDFLTRKSHTIKSLSFCHFDEFRFSVASESSFYWPRCGIQWKEVSRNST